MTVTASILYDLVECPQRVALDAFGDATGRDEISAFVRLLWQRGTLFEKETIANLQLPFVDLSDVPDADRERLTLEAMARGSPLIYGGRISADDLLGMPDLLRKETGGYVPGDIKSARAKTGGDEDRPGKPKLHYAVQLALYVDVLRRLGHSAGRRAFVWDVRGEEVEYDFAGPSGQALWRRYEKSVADARAILAKQTVPLPAHASVCKLCHWHSFCLAKLTAADDLTLIPFLRRADRDIMRDRIPTIAALAGRSPDGFIKGKKTVFAGIGADRFRALHARAALLKAPSPRAYLRKPIVLDVFPLELFFDVEVDPLRAICYLHGFVERKNGDNGTERFVPFFADEATPVAERNAFAAALDYLASRVDAGIYYYSKYERTIYRKLQDKYPQVCTPEAVEQLFKPTRAVDLYGDVVLKATEWPTRDHSIKTLAGYLGFEWRDTHPSGAASVEWYDRWCRERRPAIRQRILDYNEDDCRATRVLLDGIRGLTA
ncbi:TM0106 family RecB-like putative nuclease [Bradyrhizobium japonicum]|uniref:TM0106 family RecB-like putative nuclease n=1 Tax=Bradyrhizobium japonicum TaxID=375 RepID=UPI001BAB5437|nr:TM0106 family RecB-like putative nuclease [Bradyrhizobium japonicum]MBR0749969.1 TM0106 family RecB-like putative nuclease [Bradyrhizobium japonicum]